MNRTMLISALLLIAALTGSCRSTPPSDESKPDTSTTPAEDPKANAEKRQARRKLVNERLDAALQWLADHQSPDGRWSATKFAEDSIRTKRGAAVTGTIDFGDQMVEMLGTPNRDIGQESMTPGLTGLAMLALFTDGSTHKRGKYARNLGRGTRYIMGLQDIEGCFGPRDEEEFVYNHAVCTMALANLQAMAPDPRLKRSVQRGVDFIVRCQNAGMGWRYGIQPRENDSSITSWMLLALRNAKHAGAEFLEDEVYKGANNWYNAATGTDSDGNLRVGYIRPQFGSARLSHATKYNCMLAIDAASAVARLTTELCTVNDQVIKDQCGLFLKELPRWYQADGESSGPWHIDFYYWHFATEALYQTRSDGWNDWANAIIEPVLAKFQRGWHPKDVAKFGDKVQGLAYVRAGPVEAENPDAGRWILDEHGSWDPIDPWGSVGGRIYSTALNAMTLASF